MAKAPAKAAAPERITLPPLKIETFTVRLIGDSPLICHAWSEKAKRQMLAKQMKEAQGPKEAKSPEAEFQASLYPHPDGGWGFPAIAFKACAVDACSFAEGVTKVLARGAFHIIGEYVKIDGEPTPREDMVKIAMGTADIRFRGEFRDWSTSVTVRHNVNVLSSAQVINLFNTAGFAIGVGEWRPQRDGTFGTFHVATEGE